MPQRIGDGKAACASLQEHVCLGLNFTKKRTRYDDSLKELS